MEKPNALPGAVAGWNANPAPKIVTDTPLSRLPSWLVVLLAIGAILVALWLLGAIPKLEYS